MSSVVVASIGLGTLILGALQQTRAIDHSIVGYYAAESAAEEAMYQAKLQDALPTTVSTPQQLTNGATWTRTVTGAEQVVYLTIPRDQFAEIALYDPDAETQGTSIARVDVTWSDECSGCTVLTASQARWPAASPFTWEGDTTTFQYAGGLASMSVDGANKLSRMRLRADKGDMQDVQVRAYDAADQPLPIPGRIKIDARGSYGGVIQRLTVTLPRRVPLSGLYDYAVFSECSLVKGGPISCP